MTLPTTSLCENPKLTRIPDSRISHFDTFLRLLETIRCLRFQGSSTPLPGNCIVRENATFDVVLNEFLGAIS